MKKGPRVSALESANAMGGNGYRNNINASPDIPLKKRQGVQMTHVNQADRFELERVNLREESTLRSELNNLDSQADSLWAGQADNNKDNIAVPWKAPTDGVFQSSSDTKLKGSKKGSLTQSQALANSNNIMNQVNVISAGMPPQQMINNITINQLTVNSLHGTKNNKSPVAANINSSMSNTNNNNNTLNDSISQPVNLTTNQNIINDSTCKMYQPNDEFLEEDIRNIGMKLFQNDSASPTKKPKHHSLKNTEQVQTANFNLLASLNLTEAASPLPEEDISIQQLKMQGQMNHQHITVELLPSLHHHNSKIAGSIATEEEDTNEKYNSNCNNRKNRHEMKSSNPLQSSINGGLRFLNKEDSHDDQGMKNTGSAKYQKQTKKPRNNNSILNNASLNYFDRIKIMSSVKPKIKRFLELRTVSGRTKTLTDTIRSYINDSSDYHVSKKASMNAFLTFFRKLLMQLLILLRLNKIPIFNPESKIKIIFNSIIVSYSCFYLFICSLQIFFHADFGELTSLFHEIALVGWITEMVMEMNTAMYHHNIFITDRRIIMKIYLKEYFFFEILPLIFEGRTSETLVFNILLHLPLLLKIKGMMINLEKLEFYILQLLNKQHLFQLFKLIMQMLLLSHIVACLWNCVLQSEIKFFHPATTWVEASHILDGTWWKTYIYAQYWAFTTMKNIGTVPNTVEELLFTSFCMILSCIAFGYLLNAIGVIISDITKSQEEYKKDLNVLNSFMKRKDIDLGLKRRVNINLKKFYEQQRLEKFSTEREILNKLAPKLVDEVIEESSSKILKNFPFFYKIFSQSTITKLYGIMEEIMLAPSQIVYDRNKCIDQSFSIYLIVKGSVLYYAETSAKHEEDNYNLQSIETMHDTLKASELVQKDKIHQSQKEVLSNRHNHHYKKKVKVLTKGQSFGLVGFFTGRERHMNVQSNEYSTVIKIERSKFLQILEENENDYEKFMEVKDKLLFDDNFDDLMLFCYICGSKEHLSSDCSKVHFDRSNKHVFYRYNCSVFQERDSTFQRDTMHAFHAVKRQKTVKEDAIIFKDNNSFVGGTEENEHMEEGDEEDYSNEYEDGEERNRLTTEEADDQDEEVDQQLQSTHLSRQRKASSATANQFLQLSCNNYGEDNAQKIKRVNNSNNDEDQRQFEHCESEVLSPVMQPNTSHNSNRQIQLHFGGTDVQLQETNLTLSQKTQTNNNNITQKSIYDNSDLQRLRPKRLSTHAADMNEGGSEEGSKNLDTNKKITHSNQRKVQYSPPGRKLKGSLLTIEEKDRQPSILNHVEWRESKNIREPAHDLAKNLAASILEMIHPVYTQTHIHSANHNHHSSNNISSIQNPQVNFKSMATDGHILLHLDSKFDGEKGVLKQSQKRPKSSFNAMQASQHQSRYENSQNIKSSMFGNANSNNYLASNQQGGNSSQQGVFLQSAMKTVGNYNNSKCMNNNNNSNNQFNAPNGSSALMGNPNNMLGYNNNNMAYLQQQQLMGNMQQNFISGNNNNNNTTNMNPLFRSNSFLTKNNQSNPFSQFSQNLLMSQIEQQSFLWRIDASKNYTYYYPQYNQAEVLKRFNLSAAKRRRNKKKTKTFVEPKQKKNRHLTAPNQQHSRNDVILNNN